MYYDFSNFLYIDDYSCPVFVEIAFIYVSYLLKPFFLHIIFAETAIIYSSYLLNPFLFTYCFW